MTGLLQRLCRDECGLILSAELVVILTFGVVGMIVGLHSLAGAINCEFRDVANAFSSVRQSYGYSGFSAQGSCGRRGGFRTKSYVLGSAFNDGVARSSTGSGAANAGDFGDVVPQQHATSECVVGSSVIIETQEAPTVVEDCIEAETIPHVIVPRDHDGHDPYPRGHDIHPRGHDTHDRIRGHGEERRPPVQQPRPSRTQFDTVPDERDEN